MDIHILRLRDACEFVPDKKTYALRIFSSSDDVVVRTSTLVDSPLYVKEASYVFDDSWPGYSGGGRLLLDNPTSDLIVSDFAACKDDVDALLVHCLRGRNRSPAAAFALHEVFDLGNDLKKLREPYKPDEPNWYVYQQIVEAGKRYFECQPQS